MIEKNGGKQKKFSGDYLKSDRENSRKKNEIDNVKSESFSSLDLRVHPNTGGQIHR